MTNIFCATHSFYSEFRFFYPDAKIIKDDDDIRAADMIIFTGGEDINPEIYKQKPTYSCFNIDRDAVEIDIFEKSIKFGVPRILGVCRGHQLICALLGGLLYQDINRETGDWHEGYHGLEFTHGGGLIKKCFTEVNSMHHQGVYLVKGLMPTSVYKNVWESCEGTADRTKIYTVQFHPEFMENSQQFFNFLGEN